MISRIYLLGRAEMMDKYKNIFWCRDI